ncbi:MAG: hypothetical protein V7706_03590 [Dietzia psychralcaliphila]
MRSHNPSAGAEVAPEVWRLEHPVHGTLEVAVGGPAALRAVDDGYPRPKGDRSGRTTPEVAEEGSRELAEADSAGPDPVANPGYVLLREGEVVGRAHQIGDHRVAIDADPPEPGKFTTGLKAFSGPRVQMRSSAFATAVRQVTFRDGRDVVHFDPPPGSAAEARLEAIAASPWKRVAYPVAAGLGRSGWAIAVIILLPLIGRLLDPVLEWIFDRLPEVDLPWPNLSFPQIPWPDISLPSISLPAVSLPAWVEFLLEYSKVWVPLVIGVAFAVVAVRHSRRSRTIKESWQSGQSEQSEQ